LSLEGSVFVDSSFHFLVSILFSLVGRLALRCVKIPSFLPT
jgi:hypothetical protein